MYESMTERKNTFIQTQMIQAKSQHTMIAPVLMKYSVSTFRIESVLGIPVRLSINKKASDPAIQMSATMLTLNTVYTSHCSFISS